jgi:hypothetical protein
LAGRLDRQSRAPGLDLDLRDRHLDAFAVLIVRHHFEETARDCNFLVLGIRRKLPVSAGLNVVDPQPAGVVEALRSHLERGRIDLVSEIDERPLLGH